MNLKKQIRLKAALIAIALFFAIFAFMLFLLVLQGDTLFSFFGKLSIPERAFFIMVFLCIFFFCYHIYEHSKNTMITKALLSSKYLTEVLPINQRREEIFDLFQGIPKCYAIIEDNMVGIYTKLSCNQRNDWLEDITFDAFPVYYEVVSPIESESL